MKVTKTLRLALAAALGTIAILGPSGPALAGPATVQGCQAWSARASLAYQNGTVRDFTCSGTWGVATTQPSSFWARGWSGYYWTWGGGQTRFCDNDVVFFGSGVIVSMVQLSPTKVAGCP